MSMPKSQDHQRSKVHATAIPRRHGVKFHISAYDTQLYAEFDLQDVSSSLKALLALEECIKEIRA